MSVNFGYGTGTMGFNPMMSGMMNQGNNTGNVFQEYKNRYGCEDCYRFGAVPPAHTIHIMPLPPEDVHVSFLDKVKYYFFGK